MEHQGYNRDDTQNEQIVTLQFIIRQRDLTDRAIIGNRFYAAVAVEVCERRPAPQESPSGAPTE
jgi:hypothetical protein